METRGGMGGPPPRPSSGGGCQGLHEFLHLLTLYLDLFGGKAWGGWVSLIHTHREPGQSTHFKKAASHKRRHCPPPGLEQNPLTTGVQGSSKCPWTWYICSLLPSLGHETLSSQTWLERPPRPYTEPPHPLYLDNHCKTTPSSPQRQVKQTVQEKYQIDSRTNFFFPKHS